MTLNGIFSQSVDKDKHGRPVKASLKVGNSGCELLAAEYSYLTSGNRLTGIVDTVTHKVHGYDSGKYKYTYDVNGNITSIASESNNHTVTVREVCNKCGSTLYETEFEHTNGLIAEYEYDGLNRLVRENNYSLGETYTYKYDAAGNILSKSTYDVTSGAVVTPKDVKLYRYASTGWKDKLIVYDGQVVAYDTMGNPWSYRGHTLEWSRIRLLTKWDDIEIEYNASGIRTRKGNTYYELDGSTIISETSYGSTIRYYYGNGGIVGFRYNGNRYYYEKNLMGDIIGIYDENGSKVAGYIYDAWGNCTVQTYGTDARIGEVNPFRYRGYYYDSDIGLYYLKSRYYDAKVGRFINADGIEYLGANGDLAAYNLFAYCSDSPTNYTDSTGNTIDFSAALDWIDKEIIQPLFSILDDLVTDLKNYDKYNESEQVVLESNYFSSYKGVPVIRTNGDRSGSYGAIFLTRETNNRKHPEDVVRHEYGHTKQLEELGLVKYTVCILLPSWQEWGTGEYYSKPWEITADIYGQVQSREHDEEDIERGWKYFDNVKKIGALSLLLIE